MRSDSRHALLKPGLMLICLLGDAVATFTNPASVRMGIASFSIQQQLLSASGRVIFNGKPPGIEGVEIVFERVSPKGSAPNSARTDSNGQWRQSGFQQGATYRAIPKKQGFVFDPVSLEFSAGTRGSLSFEGRHNSLTSPDPSLDGRPEKFAASGRLTTADGREISPPQPDPGPAGRPTTAGGRGVPGVKIIFTLVFRVVSGGTRELICHRTRIGSSWTKQLETGKIYEITPDPVIRDGDINAFTPISTIIDGPKSGVNFSARDDPSVVRQQKLLVCPF